MTVGQPWFIGSWAGVVDRPEAVDEALARDDEFAGVALLALVLSHPEPRVVLPRIKRGLTSPRAATRVNAWQSVGHYARLHRSIDRELLSRLRRALQGRNGGSAATAGDDVGIFVPRRELPRWFRRRFPGPQKRP